MPKCFICREQLNLATCVKDQRGHPVHEGCFLRKLDGVEQAKKEKSRIASSHREIVWGRLSAFAVGRNANGLTSPGVRSQPATAK